MIPNKRGLVQQILTKFHSSTIGGHAGVKRTLARIVSQFYWKGMHNDVKDFVSKCQICQQAKAYTALQPGLLQPLPIPN